MSTIHNKFMKIDRLISITMVLLQKEKISAQELADMFEVSPRTIYRDIDVITMAGIPVYTTPGVGGGIGILPQYKMDKKVFSSSDLSAIVAGLSSLPSIMREDERVNALAKIKSFIPADKAKDIEVKANQILIDFSPWITNRNLQSYLQTIKIALQDNHLLSFSYIKHHGNKMSRTVEPYQLVLKNSHWYLHAFCLERQDYRLFKMTRISELQMKEERFTLRNYQKPLLDFDNSPKNVPIRVRLRVHDSIVDRVLDYCTFEDFSPDGEEYYFVDFPFLENDYNYDLLLGFGDKCECLEPLRVRSEIKRRVQRIRELYRE